MSTDLMNISAFKGRAPAQAFKVLDPQAESLADGIGSSYGIIGYKGKVWTLRLRGETYRFDRLDEPGTPAAFLDVIILRQLPNKSKSYYPPNTYQDGQIGTRPICAALNGETPDPDITQPQAAACAVCPKNVFRVTPDGRKTRDCSDYKRLAVLVLPSQTRALLGAALMEPVFLRVPAASLNDLALLGEGMSAQGFHFSSYVTRIGFNPDKPHPQMTFRALQELTDREAPMVLPLRDDATSLRITGEADLSRPRPAIVQGPQISNVVPMQQPAPAVQQPAPVQQTPAVQAEPTGPVDTGFGDPPATVTATVTQAAPPPQQPTGPVDTGFGDVGAPAVAVAPQTQQTVAANTVADTGAPEDADVDLDARVAALLPR